MEAHTPHANAATSTAEFRGAGPVRRLGDFGKEETVLRKLPEQGIQSWANLDAGPFPGFLALILEHTSLPIDVLGSQQRRVGLSCPNLPKQFVIVTPLLIVFSGDDL